MTNSQGKRPDQIQYSHVVTFFSFIGILMVFIWTALTVFWAIIATWGVFVILVLMFLNGAGKLNKAYDESFEKFHADYQIDNGICEGECSINDKGELIYF